MDSHWRTYEPLLGVAAYDTSFPVLCRTARVDVTAKIAGAEIDTPVGIVVEGICSLALTIEQLDALMERLSQARADVVRGLVTARAGGLTQ